MLNKAEDTKRPLPCVYITTDSPVFYSRHLISQSVRGLICIHGFSCAPGAGRLSDTQRCPALDYNTCRTVDAFSLKSGSSF